MLPKFSIKNGFNPFSKEAIDGLEKICAYKKKKKFDLTNIHFGGGYISFFDKGENEIMYDSEAKKSCPLRNGEKSTLA